MPCSVIGGGKSAFTPVTSGTFKLPHNDLHGHFLDGTPGSLNASFEAEVLRTSAERTAERHSCSPHIDARYLSVFLDTNSLSISNKVKDRNIAFYTNVGVSEEYRRTDNYKGGLHLIMRALGKSYSLDKVSVLPSEINISDFKAPALDEDSHVFGRLVDRSLFKTDTFG